MKHPTQQNLEDLLKERGINPTAIRNRVLEHLLNRRVVTTLRSGLIKQPGLSIDPAYPAQ